MLTETMVLTILEVSITGAGLIMAIYALITPVVRSMFKERVELRKKKKEEFDKIKKKISSNSSDKDFKRLETLASEIKKIKAFPKYLGIGVSFVFSCFAISAILCVFWLLSPTIAYEITLILLFLLSICGFFVVGIYAMSDVFLTIKREFDTARKEFEEIEKLEKEVEQVKKESEAKMRLRIGIRIYRRRKDSDTWHRCKNCSSYPTEDYEEIKVSGRPSSGELCNECLAKEKAGDCK